MRNFLPLSLSVLFCAVTLTWHGAVAAPAQPRISLVDEDGKRVVARYGVVEDALLQDQLAVKKLSFLLKKYPDATSWAVAYNTESYYWRVLEYNIERRQLVEITYDTTKSKSWGYGFFPAHIHKAAQQSLFIEGLWRLKKRNRS